MCEHDKVGCAGIRLREYPSHVRTLDRIPAHPELGAPTWATIMAKDITVLLPVRNAAEDLPAYFSSVQCFSDRIVALDDGSTDQTLQVLRRNPLVKILLRNPRREDYSAWDDGDNRNRLLRAAADLHPSWVLSLDADERIEPSDAHALLRFLQTEARPDCAYAFQMHRMIGDDRCFDLNGLWNFRLFKFRTGHRFPARRLHFQPVPVQIPPCWRIRTSLRIQHFAGLDRAKRQARFDKYRAADPTCRYQDSYANLVAPVAVRHLWQVRNEIAASVVTGVESRRSPDCWPSG